MLSDTQRKQFQEEGYFILPEAFSAEEIDTLRTKLDPFVEARESELQKVGTEGISRANEISFTAHLAEKDPHVLAFVTQSNFIAITTELIGLDISLYWDQTVYKKPETARDFPWHQDNGYTPVEPEQYVTCWLALDDVNIENGCVWVLPKSHLSGTQQHKHTEIGEQGYFGNEKGVPVELKKGGMVVFSSLLMHRSGANLSNKVRKAYIVQFIPTNARHGVTGELLNQRVVTQAGKLVQTLAQTQS